MILALVFAATTPLQRAEDAYDRYEYTKAISLLEALLQDPPKAAETRQRARFVLGLAYYLNKNDAKAKAVLRVLFRENQAFDFDRDLYHPDLVRFYEGERKAYLDSLAISVSPVPASRPAPQQQIVHPPPPPVRQTVGDRNPWLRIFPGGVGQFANHDYVAGGLFLAVELALVGLNVGGTLWRHSMRDASGDFRPGTQPVTAQILQNVGGLGAIVVAIIGIVDAFVWSPERGRKTLTVDMGPLGDYLLVLR